jgi:uncharacterized membrane protein YgcG
MPPPYYPTTYGGIPREADFDEEDPPSNPIDLEQSDVRDKLWGMNIYDAMRRTDTDAAFARANRNTELRNKCLSKRPTGPAEDLLKKVCDPEPNMMGYIESIQSMANVVQNRKDVLSTVSNTLVRLSDHAAATPHGSNSGIYKCNVEITCNGGDNKKVRGVLKYTKKNLYVVDKEQWKHATDFRIEHKRDAKARQRKELEELEKISQKELDNEQIIYDCVISGSNMPFFVNPLFRGEAAITTKTKGRDGQSTDTKHTYKTILTEDVSFEMDRMILDKVKKKDCNELQTMLEGADPNSLLVYGAVLQMTDALKFMRTKQLCHFDLHFMNIFVAHIDDLFSGNDRFLRYTEKTGFAPAANSEDTIKFSGLIKVYDWDKSRMIPDPYTTDEISDIMEPAVSDEDILAAESKIAKRQHEHMLYTYWDTFSFLRGLREYAPHYWASLRHLPGINEVFETDAEGVSMLWDNPGGVSTLMDNLDQFLTGSVEAVRSDYNRPDMQSEDFQKTFPVDLENPEKCLIDGYAYESPKGDGLTWNDPPFTSEVAPMYWRNQMDAVFIDDGDEVLPQLAVQPSLSQRAAEETTADREPEGKLTMQMKRISFISVKKRMHSTQQCVVRQRLKCEFISKGMYYVSDSGLTNSWNPSDDKTKYTNIDENDYNLVFCWVKDENGPGAKIWKINIPVDMHAKFTNFYPSGCKYKEQLIQYCKKIIRDYKGRIDDPNFATIKFEIITEQHNMEVHFFELFDQYTDSDVHFTPETPEDSAYAETLTSKIRLDDIENLFKLMRHEAFGKCKDFKKIEMFKERIRDNKMTVLDTFPVFVTANDLSSLLTKKRNNSASADSHGTSGGGSGDRGGGGGGSGGRGGGRGGSGGGSGGRMRMTPTDTAAEAAAKAAAQQTAAINARLMHRLQTGSSLKGR